LELGRGAHPASYMVEEIWQELSKAKYVQWEGLSTMRSSQLHKLKCVINIFLALLNYYKRDVLLFLPNISSVIFRATCKEAIRNYNSLGNNTAADVSEEHLNALDEVFKKAAKADTPTEVRNCLKKCLLTLA
jgi:STIP1 family protein 1